MTNKILALARAEIVAMSAYRSARSEQKNDQMQPTRVWLDANENPWDDGNNRYPEPQPYALTKTLAGFYNIKAEQLLMTRGSDEGIDLLVRLFCRANQDQIMICPPTYGMYKIAATIQGAGIKEVPLLKTENFALNVRSILGQWQPNIKVIFLCSPNNPTGNLLATADILGICRQLKDKAIVVVDEAYIEFSSADSLAQYLSGYSNLVILRTLSKAYGLAGIRCGATLANPIIIQLLKKIIAPYPLPKSTMNVVFQQLATSDLGKKIKIINQEKEKIITILRKFPFVKKVWSSHANFVLFEVNDAKKIMTACLQRGVVLRDRSCEYDLNNCIRVTIGKPSDNKIFLEVLTNV